MLTFIDLFAGIGGFRLALEQVGMKCVFTSEIDRYAKEIYAANFSGKIDGDIATIKEFPQADMVVAGFPCQPFSLLRTAKGQHPSHNCFDLLINVIKVIQPKAFLLENVPALAQGKNVGFLGERLTKLVRAGYYINYAMLDALNFVPQRRKRLFILGGKKWPRFPNIIPKEHVVASIVEREAPAEFDIPSKTISRYRRHIEAQKTKGNTFRIQYVGPNDPAYCLTAHYSREPFSNVFLDGPRQRRFTPRECARLMGFPDSFLLPTARTNAYKCLGNSVCVPLVKKIVEAMS